MNRFGCLAMLLGVVMFFGCMPKAPNATEEQGEGVVVEETVVEEAVAEPKKSDAGEVKSDKESDAEKKEQ